MTPLSDLPPLDAEEGVFDALERMESEERDGAPVVRQGVLVGLVSRGDLARFVQVYTPARRRWRW